MVLWTVAAIYLSQWREFGTFQEAHEKPHHLKGQHFGLEHHDNYGFHEERI